MQTDSIDHESDAMPTDPAPVAAVDHGADAPSALKRDESAVASDVHAKIDAWWAKHQPHLLSRLETEIYNALHAAKEELKALLGGGSPS